MLIDGTNALLSSIAFGLQPLKPIPGLADRVCKSKRITSRIFELGVYCIVKVLPSIRRQHEGIDYWILMQAFVVSFGFRLREKRVLCLEKAKI